MPRNSLTHILTLTDKKIQMLLYFSVAILFASLFTVFLFRLVLPESFLLNESSDFHVFYLPVAQNIQAGYGIRLMPDQGIVFRYPPGFPIILAALFSLGEIIRVSEPGMLLVLIYFSTSVTALLLFATASTLWKPSFALIASVFLVTYPLFLWNNKQPNSELPFMLVLYAGVGLYWYVIKKKRRGWYGISFAVGIIIGAAMLIRPMAIGLGLLLASVTWFLGAPYERRSRILMMTLILLGNFIIILPWEYAIYKQADRIVPLSTGGGSYVIAGGLRYAHDASPNKPVMMPENVWQIQVEISTTRNEYHSMSTVTQMVRGYLQTRPLDFLHLLIRKSLRPWYGTDSMRYETPVVGIQVVYLSLLMAAIIRSWQLGGETRSYAILLLFILGYAWFMSFLVLSIVRYMVPFIGMGFALIPALASYPKVIKFGLLVKAENPDKPIETSPARCEK